MAYNQVYANERHASIYLIWHQMDIITMNYMIEAAIQDLRSADRATRLKATEYLRDHPHVAAIDPLIEILSDQSVDVAYGAAEALTVVGVAVEAHLLAAFGNIQDESTLYLLLVTLAVVATVESEDLLVDALYSGNPDFAEVAAEALRRINTPNARRILDEWGA